MFNKLFILGFCLVSILCSFDAIAALKSKANFKTVVIKKTDKNFDFDGQYPQLKIPNLLESQLNRINKEVERFAKQRIVKDLKELQNSKLTDADREILGGAFQEMKNHIGITFKVIRADEQYVSIKFERYAYFLGAAHGMTRIMTFNYDVKRQRIISLGGLFDLEVDYLNFLSKVVIKDLTRQLGDSLEDWIKEGASPDKKFFSVFSIGLDGLTIYFQPYQVASYASGEPEVNIPFSDLSGILIK